MNYTEESKDRKSSMLAADTSHGVYVSEIPSDAEVVLYDEDFLEAIGSKFEEYGVNTIYGIVDDSTLAKIVAEYGI
jgi:hypothetical protein